MYIVLKRVLLPYSLDLAVFENKVLLFFFRTAHLGKKFTIEIIYTAAFEKHIVR